MKVSSYRGTLVLLAICALVGWAHAQEPAGQPLAATPAPQKQNHEVRTLGKCSFIVKNTLKGEFRSLSQDGTSEYTDTGYVKVPLPPRYMDLSIPLRCHLRSDQERLEMELGAKQVIGKWQPAGGNEAGCERRKSARTGGCEYSTNLPFYPEQNMRVVTLTGSNWQGTGIFIDDTTGDEKWRQRSFRYCLYHADVAVCGRADVRYLRKPHNDVLDKVLTVLNSVEFVK